MYIRYKRTTIYIELRALKARKANFEHYDGIAKGIDRTEDLKRITINNQSFYFTESLEVTDNSVKEKIIEYISNIEDDWNRAKTVISNIVSTIVLSIIISTIMLCICSRKIRNTERRINLIEGFLPTEVRVNLATTERNSNPQILRRNSSFHIDSRTQYLLDKIAFSNNI